MPGTVDDIVQFIKLDCGERWSDEHELQLRGLDKRSLVCCPAVRQRYMGSLMVAKMKELDFFGDEGQDFIRDEAGAYSWMTTNNGRISANAGFDFYGAATMTGKNGRSGYSPVMLHSRYWAKSAQEEHVQQWKRQVEGPEYNTAPRFVFGYGSKLKYILEEALTTKLSPPARRSIGQNPERVAMECRGCEGWTCMVGTCANQTWCVDCINKNNK